MSIRGTILLVEDDPNMRMGLEDNLHIEGYTTASAPNCREGRRLVRERQVDMLCFATKRLDLQRFQVVLASYLLMGRAGRRLILDETGRSIPVTWPRFVFLSLPRFVVELLASAVIIAASTVRLTFLATSLRRKGTR